MNMDQIVVYMPTDSAKKLSNFIYENSKDLEACADGDKLYVRTPIVVCEDEKQRILSEIEDRIRMMEELL